MTPKERAERLSREWGGNPNISAVTKVIEEAVQDETDACTELLLKLESALWDLEILLFEKYPRLNNTRALAHLRHVAAIISREREELAERKKLHK